MREFVEALSTKVGSVDVPFYKLPMMVILKDSKDPRILQEIDPERLSQYVYRDARLLNVSVRLTRDPVVLAEQMPVVSLSMQESEIAICDAEPMGGHYVAWNCLAAIEGKSNRDFTDQWRRISGNPQAVPNDSLKATYIGFNLWKRAVEAAGTTSKAAVRASLKRLDILSPSGYELAVTQDQHTSLPAFVGRFEENGSITVVWTAGYTLLPDGTRLQALPVAV